jgi:hypothetical protein
MKNSKLMRKKYSIFICLALFILSLSIVLVSLYNRSNVDIEIWEFQNVFKDKIPKGIIPEKLYNSYGGFHNEGQKLYKLSFSKENADVFISEMESSNSWSKLPLSEPLNLLMFGGTKTDKTYCFLFANKVGLPDIKNGYWKFINENTEKDILNSTLFKFSLAIFDKDNNVLYLYKIHT